MSFRLFMLGHAAGIMVFWPLLCVVEHLIGGSRPLITEFEQGGIAGAVIATVGIGLVYTDRWRV